MKGYQIALLVCLILWCIVLAIGAPGMMLPLLIPFWIICCSSCCSIASSFGSSMAVDKKKPETYENN